MWGELGGENVQIALFQTAENIPSFIHSFICIKPVCTTDTGTQHGSLRAGEKHHIHTSHVMIAAVKRKQGKARRVVEAQG